MKSIPIVEYVTILQKQITSIEETAINEHRDLDPSEKIRLESTKHTLKQIEKMEFYFGRIIELAQKDYVDESIILTVTFFEITMKNIIKDNKKVWFYLPHGSLSELTLDKKVVVRNKIKRYLDKIRLYDNYIKNFYLYYDSPDPEIETLYHVLFDENRLNFQNLADNNGVKDLFKFLFDIDIRDFLDTNKKISRQKWSNLDRLIKDRHNIIHNGERATLKTDEVIEILNSLDSAL
jgi:hypothetical protein